MSEYGSGLTFGQTRNLDKERIKRALRGELVCGEDENGFIYAKANREDCERFILAAYDDCVYHAKQAMDSGRALERLLKSKGVEVGVTYTLDEYMTFTEEATREFDDYLYEDEKTQEDTPPEITPENKTGDFPVLNITPRTIAPSLTNGGTLRSLDNRRLAAWLAREAERISTHGVCGEEEYFKWLNDPANEDHHSPSHGDAKQGSVLRNALTCELVEELKKRDGVETITAESYIDKSVCVKGPAVVLIVTD